MPSFKPGSKVSVLLQVADDQYDLGTVDVDEVGAISFEELDFQPKIVMVGTGDDGSPVTLVGGLDEVGLPDGRTQMNSAGAGSQPLPALAPLEKGGPPPDVLPPERDDDLPPAA
jgi:hypothetical protein